MICPAIVSAWLSLFVWINVKCTVLVDFEDLDVFLGEVIVQFLHIYRYQVCQFWLWTFVQTYLRKVFRSQSISSFRWLRSFDLTPPRYFGLFFQTSKDKLILFQLSFKAEVGQHIRPCFPNKTDGLFESFVLLFHEIGDNKCGTLHKKQHTREIPAAQCTRMFPNCIFFSTNS